MKVYHFLLFALFSIQALTAQKTETLYLSGTDKDHTVPWDFYCTAGRNSGKWTQIPVPSCWELQGFGTYNYGHDKKKGDEKGLYKHTFSIPADWKDKRIYIVFEGSMTDTHVKINGKSAGPIHQGAFYQFRYDISRLLVPTKPNLLEVTVSKMSTDTSVNRAERQSDFWVFGGIFRPVYLEAFPSQFMERVAVDARADGHFAVDVFLQGIKDAQQVEAQIQTLDGRPVGKPFAVNIPAKATSVRLTTKTDNPALWSPEFPNLYQVVLRLQNKKEPLHTITQKFGFRTVEVRQRDGIYVNGAKIKFKGVNRHSFWPSSGRTLSKELSIVDVNLMKDMNMNAVRMSHYPPDQHFLDVCDSLGLFVLDELTGWQKAYDTEVGKKLVRELVIRDVNHPSIILWDNGNEGGWNTNLDDEFAKWDPQKRHVIHPWEVFNGTDTQHYRPFTCCTGSLFNGNEIFFPTEFLHGLYDGGHGAGLDDYWTAMWQHPLSAGGFLWVFSDEAIVRTDKNDSLDTDGNHAPDGILGPYREKEASFYTIKQIWSPIYIEPFHITPQFSGEIVAENRFHYTNLNQCTLQWKLIKFPAPNETTQTTLEWLAKEQNWQPLPVQAEPGTRTRIKLSLPDNWQLADALVLTATDPHGREIYTWTFPAKTPAVMASMIVPSAPASLPANSKNLPGKGKKAVQVKSSEEGNHIVLSANGIVVKIDKKTGLLAGATNEQTSISLSNGPVLAAGSTEFESIKYYADGNDYVVEVNHKGALRSLIWRMHPTGWLQLDYRYQLKGPIDFAGINFDYPESKVTGLRWLGKGPYRVWKNRMKGAELGVWEKQYNDTRTGETWLYPEFKGYHANMYWAVIQTTEAPITVVSATEDLFLRMLTPGRPKSANANTYPPFPTGSISFLHGIPAIGTKFTAPEASGPASHQNQFSPLQPLPSGRLYFHFGEWDKEARRPEPGKNQ